MMADPFAYDENMARWAKGHTQNSWQKARMPASTPQQGLASAPRKPEMDDAQQPPAALPPQPAPQRPPSPGQAPILPSLTPTVSLDTPTVSPSSMTQYYDQFNKDNNTTLGYRDGGPIRGPKGDDQVPGLMPDGEPARLQDGEYVLPASVVDALGGPQTLDKLVASITGNQPGPVEKPPLPGQKLDMPPMPPVDAEGYKCGGRVKAMASGGFLERFKNRAGKIDAVVDAATGAQPSAPKAPPSAPQKEEKFVPQPGEFDREAFMRDLYRKTDSYSRGGMVKSYAAGGSSEFDETPADRYGVRRFGDQSRALARQERDLPGVAQDIKAAGTGYGGFQTIQNLRAQREYALKPDKPTPAPKYRGNPPSSKPAAPVTPGTRRSDYDNADYSKLPPPAAPSQTPPSARPTQGVWYEGPGSGKASSVGLSGDTMTAANARLRELTGGQAGTYMGTPPASPGGAPNYGPTDHERRMASTEALASLAAARKLAGMAPNERGRSSADQIIGTQHRDNLAAAQRRAMGVQAATDLERAKQGPPKPPSAADQLKQRELENYDRDRLTSGIAEVFKGSAEEEPEKTQAKQGMFTNAAVRIANEYNVDPNMLLSSIRALNLSLPPLLPPDEWAQTDDGKALTKQAEAARKDGRAVPNPYAQYMQEYSTTLYDQLLASLMQ